MVLSTICVFQLSCEVPSEIQIPRDLQALSFWYPPYPRILAGPDCQVPLGNLSSTNWSSLVLSISYSPAFQKLIPHPDGCILNISTGTLRPMDSDLEASLNVEYPLCAPHRTNALQWIWGILSMPKWDVPHHPKWRLKGHFWTVAVWGVFLEASSISLGLSYLIWSQKKHLSPLLIEMTCTHLKMQRNPSLQITVDHFKCRCTAQVAPRSSPHTAELS